MNCCMNYLLFSGLVRKKPAYFDGYGGEGCEKITILNKRTQFQRLNNAVAIAVSGLVVFALLVTVKGSKNKKT